MTQVQFLYQDAYNNPTRGSLAFTPHRRHAANETEILPKPFTMPLVNGGLLVDLEPNTESWVWIVTEYFESNVESQYYTIPDQDGVIDSVELIPINPSSIPAPYNAVEPVWWAELRQYKQVNNDTLVRAGEALSTAQQAIESGETAKVESAKSASLAKSYFHQSRQHSYDSREYRDSSREARDGAREAEYNATHGPNTAADRAEAAQTGSETARDETITARNETFTARDESVTARDETLTARDEAVTAHDETLEALDQVLEPGYVTDTQTANLINQSDSNTNSALQHNIQRSVYPVDAGTVTDFWEPPTQPAGPNLNSWSASDIYATWDDIMETDTAYVARSSIGNGTDDLPIYAYTFTPPAYGNTILLTAMHGAEKIGMYTVAQTMRLMVEQWQDHPALAALRARTRIVVVPIASRHAADNNNRTNANGVDLNRNWDQFWDDMDSSPGSATYKGTAPFSEPETRAIRDLTQSLQAQGGLVAALDIHDTGAPVRPDGFHFYAVAPSRGLPGGGNWIRQIIDEITTREQVSNPNVQLSRTDTPTARNWFAAQGLWSATIEYEMRWGTESMDSTNMTAALRWIGNVIIRSAQQGSLTSQKPAPFVKRFAFNSASTTVSIPPGSTDTPPEIEEFGFEFVPPCAGFVEFYGDIAVSGAQPDRVYITPTAGQLGTTSGVDTPSASYDALYESHGGGYSNGVTTIPFSIATEVIENPRFPVKIGIHAVAVEHEAVVYRYRATMKFTPTDAGGRFEQYSATSQSGPDAMRLIRRA